MRKFILPLFLVFILLASGCVSLDPTSLVKAQPAVSKFLEDYPNAEVKAVHYTVQESESIVDDIMADCEKEAVEPKEYYKVTITDVESDLDVVAWVDVKNQVVECVVKRGSTGGDNDDDDETRPSYYECTTEQKNATICTMEYSPVCAQVDTGIRCVTTPCPSTEWKTFSNACVACSTDNVLGWKQGECGDVCQSKYKAKCDGGHVYWYDSCGNKEGKKEYCPLGCSNGACIKDEKVCEVGKNYMEKPACNCPSGYDMIVVYPRCEQTQEETNTQASTSSGGGSGATSGSDGITGQITGFPIAEAVKTDTGEVKIAEQYTTEAAERCAGSQPFYRCVKKEQCKPYSKAACNAGHVYWYDSCGNVQEKKEYCENGCSNGLCEAKAPCPMWSQPAPGWCEDGTIVSGGKDENGCQLPPQCIMPTNVCCESYGYGSQMTECCQTYAWTTAGQCATPEGLVGGGKRIVDDDYCGSGCREATVAAGSSTTVTVNGVQYVITVAGVGENNDAVIDINGEQFDVDTDDSSTLSIAKDAVSIRVTSISAIKFPVESGTVKMQINCDSASAACTDTDGGKNYYLKGRIYGTDEAGIYQDLYDYCWPDNRGVMEGFCTAAGNVNFYSMACKNGCANGACRAEPVENCTNVPFVDADGDGCNAGTDSNCGGIEGVNNPNVTCHNMIDDDCDGLYDGDDLDLSCNLECGDRVCGWYESIPSSDYYCEDDCEGEFGWTNLLNNEYVSEVPLHSAQHTGDSCLRNSLSANSGDCYPDGCSVLLNIYGYASNTCAAGSFEANDYEFYGCERVKVSGEDVYLCIADNSDTSQIKYVYNWLKNNAIITVGSDTDSNLAKSYLEWIIENY